MGLIHKQVVIAKAAGEVRDIIVALLGNMGYTGFEEQEHELLAFISIGDFDKNALDELAAEYTFSYELADVEERNWNAIWEAEFEPVIVGEVCTIRAHFHAPATNTKYEIVITPKMSFGTGHHATTQLMIMGMQDVTFEGKKVLDFGTGTGVLAILAERLGSTDILAIDNDEWAVNNSIENVERNNCDHIRLKQASLEDLDSSSYDVILANINRHILLATMPLLFQKTSDDGLLIMSGLLEDDEAIVSDAARQVGFVVADVNKRNGWISIRCGKC